MDALGHQRFAVVGVDTGLLISYALAADHPERVDRLVVGEAPLPGVSPPTPLVLPEQVKARLWHIPFNQQEKVNEQLVKGGRTSSSARSSPPRPARTSCPTTRSGYYVDSLSDPEALHGSFQLYRAFDTTVGAERAAQDAAAHHARSGDRRERKATANDARQTR